MNPLFNGVNLSNVLVQQTGAIGGGRFVFVKLQGVKNDLVFPPIGGKLKNPFKGVAKAYAGDLVEYRTDENGENPEILLLKTFEVAATVAAEATSLTVVANGYRHIPFVGDVLMKAPTTATGTGTAVTVSSVQKGDGVYTLGLSGAIGALSKGDILVEAVEAGTGKKALVPNPNAFLPCDYDFAYAPQVDENDFYGARYLIAPALHGTAYITRMSPVPAFALKLNKSNVNGWFAL